MTHPTLRVGLIGAGANTRAKHIPGLLALPEVQIVAVCNRRPESTAAVARDFDIPRPFERWEDLVADDAVDAVVIGAWPYLHCPVTLAALAAGKHVLTEARMATNADEARQMLAAARERPDLVAQIVPSPYGLKGGRVMRELVASGRLGELREVQVVSFGAALADPAAPLGWRQDAGLSGVNVLNLGILHETLARWVPPSVSVFAQASAFVPTRIDPASGARRAVETPDAVRVLAVLEGGAHAVYHLSAATPFGQAMGVSLYGSEGALHYDLSADRIFGAFHRNGGTAARREEMLEIPIPTDQEDRWRVEEDFVRSIRHKAPVGFTDFPAGVAYMEFTEAVAQSVRTRALVELPEPK
jgi:predicted dehydrogenase